MKLSKEIFSGIYKITSPTGRIYIGKSKDIISRWRRYERDFYKERTIGQPNLERSFRKYGIESHVFDIVETCGEDKLNDQEIYWISFLNSYKKGMNCSLGGDGGNGIKWSQESKKKMSEKWKGKRLGADNPNYGKGEKIRGKNHVMFGKKQPKEKVEKNIESNKKTWANIIKSDWYNSEEQKKKRSLYNSGRTRSVEVRGKTKEANIKTWAGIVNSRKFNSEEAKKVRSERIKKGLLIRKNNPNFNVEEQRAKDSQRMRKTWAKMKENGYVRPESSKLNYSVAAKNRQLKKRLINEQFS